jgi:hypothetical protein
VFKVIVFLKRKAGITREEFIRYYEDRHQKLVQQLLPPIADYRRNYPVYADPLNFSGLFDDPANFGKDSTTHAEPPFDVITEISFHDRSGFEALMNALRFSPAGEKIAADELHFLSREGNRVLVVEEYRSN